MEGPLPLWGRAFVVFGGGWVRGAVRSGGRGGWVREAVRPEARGPGAPGAVPGPGRYPTGTPGVAIPRPPVTVLSPEIVTGQVDAS